MLFIWLHLLDELSPLIHLKQMTFKTRNKGLEVMFPKATDVGVYSHFLS